MTTAPGDGQGEKTAAGRTEKILQWLGRPTPRWSACLVTLSVLISFALLLLLWISGSGDHVSKRWKTVNQETETKLYGELVHRFASERDDKPLPPPPHRDWSQAHVAVYSVAATPHPLPTLRDLDDRGQAAAIEFLERTPALEGKSWTQLRDILSDSGAADPGEKDPFQFNRLLVATVAKGASWDPGDRMMWSRVFVQPINFSFAGYTVAETENETVKVASIEATTSRKFSADIGLTSPGMEGPKASVGPSDEHSVKTTSDITAQYEKLGIDIMPDFLRIIRESETGGDVDGNTMVSLSVVTDPLTIQKRSPKEPSPRNPMGDDIVLLVTGTHLDTDGVSPDDGKTQPPADGKKELPITVLPQVPVPHCALLARVWMLYEERQVDSGRESYDEARQTVNLLRDAEDQEDLQIMSADEVSPAVWSIQICDSNKCDGKSDNPLQASVKNGQGRKVVFTDYGQAVKLAHWLRTTQHNSIPGSNLIFNYPSDGNHSLIPVKKTGDECQSKKPEEVSQR
jgi:hypothetical protein